MWFWPRLCDVLSVILTKAVWFGQCDADLGCAMWSMWFQPWPCYLVNVILTQAVWCAQCDSDPEGTIIISSGQEKPLQSSLRFCSSQMFCLSVVGNGFPWELMQAATALPRLHVQCVLLYHLPASDGGSHSPVVHYLAFQRRTSAWCPSNSLVEHPSTETTQQCNEIRSSKRKCIWCIPKPKSSFVHQSTNVETSVNYFPKMSTGTSLIHWSTSIQHTASSMHTLPSMKGVWETRRVSKKTTVLLKLALRINSGIIKLMPRRENLEFGIV